MRRTPSSARSLLAMAFLAGAVAVAHAQPTVPPPPDRQIEYPIETLRLSVPLKFHHPQHWDNPPRPAFGRLPRDVDAVLMWPNLSDPSDPESQRCIERMMMGTCRDVVTFAIHGRSELAEQTEQRLMADARPAPVGVLHGFEVSRRTTPIPPSTRMRARAYLRIVGPDMGDPGKISGYCNGLWQETVPETLPEIERQLLACLLRYNLSDKVVASITTFAHGLPRWKQLYARINGLLEEWQRAAR